jgi:hypothetical protein
MSHDLWDNRKLSRAPAAIIEHVPGKEDDTTQAAGPQQESDFS